MRLDINYRRIDVRAIDGFALGVLVSAAIYGLARGAQAIKRWWKKEAAA